MVLLDDVVQVLDLPHENSLRSSDVDGFQSWHIGTALINDDFFGCAVALDSLCEEPACRALITMRPRQEIDGLTCLVDSIMHFNWRTTALAVALRRTSAHNKLLPA
jgi:hypothetical protein